MGSDPVGLGLLQEGVMGHRGRPAWRERMWGALGPHVEVADPSGASTGEECQTWLGSDVS